MKMFATSNKIIEKSFALNCAQAKAKEKSKMYIFSIFYAKY